MISKNPVIKKEVYSFVPTEDKRLSKAPDIHEKKQTKAHILRSGKTLSVIAFVILEIEKPSTSGGLESLKNTKEEFLFFRPIRIAEIIWLT